MEKHNENHVTVDHDEDLMIDLGDALEQTEGGGPIKGEQEVGMDLE